jgi:hypothetical protein
MYNEKGELVPDEGTTFRQVGWQINGGENDKLLIGLEPPHALANALSKPHGGYSPIYVEVNNE